MRPAIDSGKLVRWYDFQARFYRVWRHRHGGALARRVAEGAAGPSPGARVLDAACGTGLFALALARAFPQARVVGIDLSSGMLAVAAREARRLRLHNLRLGRADVARLPFRDDAFELVLAGSLLPNVDDWSAVLRELGRVLAPSGRLLVVEVDRDTMGPGSRWFFRVMILGFRTLSFVVPRFRFAAGWNIRSSTVDRDELERSLTRAGLRARAVRTVHGHLVFEIEKGASA